MSESKSFKAKWPGRCGICNEEYKTNDWVHFVGVKTVAHDYCHGRNYEPPSESERDRSQPFVVKGRRNHEKRCGTCGYTHAGACP